MTNQSLQQRLLLTPPTPSPLTDFLFKFLVIGNANTGKSCLLHQFIENKCMRANDAAQRKYCASNTSPLSLPLPLCPLAQSNPSPHTRLAWSLGRRLSIAAARLSNCRSGTQPARSASAPSPAATTAAPPALSWSTTFPGEEGGRWVRLGSGVRGRVGEVKWRMTRKVSLWSHISFTTLPFQPRDIHRTDKLADRCAHAGQSGHCHCACG